MFRAPYVIVESFDVFDFLVAGRYQHVEKYKYGYTLTIPAGATIYCHCGVYPQFDAWVEHQKEAAKQTSFLTQEEYDELPF